MSRYLSNVSASVMSNPTVNTAFLDQATGTRAILNPPNDFTGNRLVTIRAAVKFTTPVSNTCTYRLYWWGGVDADSTTFTSDVCVTDTLAISFVVNNTTTTAFLQAQFIWSPDLTRLNGYYWTSPDTGFTPFQTALNSATRAGFFIVARMDTSDASNKVSLTQFTMDQE